MSQPVVLLVTVEEHWFPYSNGHNVFLNGKLIGFRASSGRRSEEDAVTEVTEALAEMLSVKLGWPDPDTIKEE